MLLRYVSSFFIGDTTSHCCRRCYMFAVSICSCSLIYSDLFIYSVLIPASCSVTPRPIQHYPDLYRGSIIFVDFPFQCSGSVSAVEFYAERAGTFYFSAWRPSASGDSWMFLGYSAIESEREGSQVIGRRGDGEGGG